MERDHEMNYCESRDVLYRVLVYYGDFGFMIVKKTE